MAKELEISGKYVVKENLAITSLVIKDDAEIIGEEGKYVVLKVNGAGVEIKPGTYYGDIELITGEYYDMAPHGLMKLMQKHEAMKNALVIADGKIDTKKSAISMFNGGTITDGEASDFTLLSSEGEFGGILVTGRSTYEINNADISFEGRGRNDFAGVGAGVAAIDHAKVSINDSTITLASTTRCAVHVGGSAVVEVNDCSIVNQSPADPEWMGDFSWGIGVTGTNRLVQMADDGTVYYNNCYMKTNGWGVFSIDGCNDCARIFVNDCDVDLTGPRANGYGGFCIGDRNIVSFANSRIHVNGYAAIIRGMIDGAAKTEFIDGCEVTGNRFGIISIGDVHTPVTISDSYFHTGRAVLVPKGSSTCYDIISSNLESDEGVILQLMDNDDPTMEANGISTMAGLKDTYVEGRDLAEFHEGFDVEMNLIDDELVGDFYNSTTNLHREEHLMKGDNPMNAIFGGLFAPPADGELPPPPQEDHEKDALESRDEINYDKMQRGPKNLQLNMINTTVEGRISSATQKYREGLEWITADTRLELSNVTQEAAPTVNNGVIVYVDTDSTWIVTGTCYLTKLSLGEHALVRTFEDKELTMTVDGKKTPIEQGMSYTGTIVLTVA